MRTVCCSGRLAGGGGVGAVVCEAAVKHTLIESENPKYLGTGDGMINVGLMTKLYHVVAHNLNEARKARDGNKKGKTPKEPEKLKVGDNILVRDHTSKTFQPKYKSSA